MNPNDTDPAELLRTHPVWRWLPLSAAVHALLPLALGALWWLAGAWWVGQALLGLHILTALVLVGTLPWWWRHLGSVVLLVLVDHIITFVVVVVMSLVWS